MFRNRKQRKQRRQADKQNRVRPARPEKSERRPPKSAPRNCAQGSRRVLGFAARVTLVQAGIVAIIVFLIIAILVGVTR